MDEGDPRFRPVTSLGRAALGSGSLKETMVDRVSYSRGRAMFPVILHRTLVGTEDVPIGEVRAGDLIACAGRNLPPFLRALEPLGDRDFLTCLAEYQGRRVRVGRREYQGVVRWQSCRGFKRNLDSAGRSFSLKLYLAAAGAESRFGLPSCPRRWISRFTAGSPDLDGGARERAYLLQSLRAVILKSGGALSSPPRGLDWDVCLDLSLGHAVHKLLQPLWNSLPERVAPPGHVRDLLAVEAEKVSATWREGREILHLLLPSLAEEKIPCILLKGPSLADAYGRRAGTRPFGDLDLLVRPQDLGESLEHLERLSFATKAGKRARGLILKGHFHLVMKPPPPWALPVELHWNLIDRGNLYRIDLDSLFTRAVVKESSSGALLVLSPEDELLYLCLHLSKHGVLNRLALTGGQGSDWLVNLMSGNRLIWFVDLFFCLAKEGARPAPSLLWERARSWNCEDSLLECLRLLNKLFPSPRTEEYLEATPLSVETKAKERSPYLAGEGKQRRFLSWAMTVHPVFTVRPVRLFELWGLFFPNSLRLSRYYGNGRGWGRLWRRLTHPFAMAMRLWGR